MRFKLLLTPTIILLFIFYNGFSIFAQSNVISSGGEISGLGGNSSFSLGQIFYITKQNATEIVSEGLQQPLDLYLVTDVTDVKLSISVFPNPSTYCLYISINEELKNHFSYKFMSIDGHLLFENVITKNLTIIDVKDLSPKAYLLIISRENKQIKVYKIIKH